MDVRALVILGGAEGGKETVSGNSTALLPVLGRSVLDRTLQRLGKHGISAASVVSEYGVSDTPREVRWLRAQSDSLWTTVQEAFADMSQGGAELILVVRLGPYAEVDYEDLVQFHLDQDSRLTPVVRPNGEMLGTFVINPSRRNDAAYLFRHALKTSRLPHSFYEFTGYVNALADAGDLRQLAIDAFCGNAKLQPDGVEIRPGVWVAPTARIHKRARVLAPAYIGAHARVRAAAVITRCSALEHHAHVDCGTVVDNATLLPNTFVGAGLDIARAVVGFRRFAHLGRNVDVDIVDPKLVSTVSVAPIRLLGQLASLAGYLPVQLARGLANRSAPEPVSLPEAVQEPAPALKKTVEEQVPGSFAVVRRYGND